MSVPHKYLLSTNCMPISVLDEKMEKMDMVPALQFKTKHNYSMSDGREEWGSLF